ncbi:MAG: ankyrin repeat domain-containing protein [Nitrospirae bacterium]|nr:ankyrin repeat domain-containing protein [Nitrospirota bacterium]
MALGRGLIKNVRLLLENGASVDKPTRYDPLYAALGSSEEKTLLILKYGADIPGGSNDGSTFLMQMAAAGHANVIRVLLDRSMDPNEEDQSGNTALMLASQAGRKEAVTLLLNHGAAVNARNYNDETALIMAAKRGWGAVAEILLDHGADVDLKDSSGETALIHAVRQLATDPKCISILLEKGADPNTRNNRGETPLHLIVNKVKDPLSDYYNKIWIKTAQMLISNGADVRAENNFGVTPMKIANRNNVRAMIEFLEENGAGRFE